MSKNKATERRLSRRRWKDKAAAWFVSMGGTGIILVVLGLLVFILAEIWPLTQGADVEAGDSVDAPAPSLAILCDEYDQLRAILGRDGRLRFMRTSNRKTVEESVLVAGLGADEATGLRLASQGPDVRQLAAATPDGRVVVARVSWKETFVEGKREMQVGDVSTAVLSVGPEGAPVTAYAARMDSEGAAMVVGQVDDGPLRIVSRTVEVNEFTEETEESIDRAEAPAPAPCQHLLLDAELRNLYGASGSRIFWWKLLGTRLGDVRELEVGGAPVTALGLLIGDKSLIVGQADGTLSIWFQVRQGDGTFAMRRIREFPPQGDAILQISPSARNKGFMALDASGEAGLYFSTSERVLWTGSTPLDDANALFFAPRGDRALVLDGLAVAALSIDNPHPDAGWKAYFGKVWYETFDEPEHIWQSSAADDDYEPKLSLVPIIAGTLKGTLFSLLLAVPVAVLAALFASQFMHPRLRRIIKPMVEIMASFPSVVLGLIGGLWLAPRIEEILPGLFAMILVIPLVAILGGWSWERLPSRFRNRLPGGTEVFPMMVFITAGIAGCITVSAGIEEMLADGDYRAWLLDVMGLRYDQQNAVVVSIAMGFAVIPIIFTIAEEAFSNVPRGLTLGSLALGADPWQTVTRVVLPSASPGIFSAIMVGFGRAVGETMIVVMATGNTPLMDWNPFNGFRTLSANIAVEIPEAPHGSTLYRTLFLAALLLFSLTFLINTVAEVVRDRLRKRYANL